MIGSVNAQKFEVSVTKEKAKIDYDGYLLKVKVIRNDSIFETKPGDYYAWNGFLREFNLSERVMILKKISPFLNDFSLCSRKVYSLLPLLGEVMTKQRPFKEKRYTIAVEAMFFINWAVFSDKCRFLSTFPVLLNVKTKKVVNYNDKKSIKSLANKYRDWIKRKASGEAMRGDDMFFLINGDIIWNGSEGLLTEDLKLIMEKYFYMGPF